MSAAYTHVREASTGSASIQSEEIFEEGRILRLPLSTSPFKISDPYASLGAKPPIRPVGSDDVELKVAEEVPWIDLLLELSMTTAFASLTDGASVSDAAGVASYISFFSLVWWIWASQVAYNVRFRQPDILHRLFVFLQLLVFAALAAFTEDFDITLLTAPSTQVLIPTDVSLLAAQQHRSDGLATANARGISLVLAISRLLLLIQYAVAFLYARKLSGGRRAIGINLASLAISSLSYFAAYGILHGNPTEVREILKICLWFGPIILEAGAHYFAGISKGHVPYPEKALLTRSATVFIIVLGGGLDKITGGLRILVGNGGIRSSPWGLLGCTALIFICQFTLYFNGPAEKRLPGLRLWTWFLLHFFYLSALIVTLQGIAGQLTFGRLGEAFNQFTNALEPSRQFVLNNPGVNISCCADYPDAEKLFMTNGWSLSDYMTYINSNIEWGVEHNNSIVGYNTWIQQYVDGLASQMVIFDVTPSGDLYDELIWFIDYADPSNSSQINATATGAALNGIWKAEAMTSTWLFAVSGSTLITLAIINIVGLWPKDRWYWLLWIARMLAGIALVSLSTLDRGSAAPEYNSNDVFTPTLLWKLVDEFMILPIIALVFLAEQCIEVIILALAYHSDSDLVQRIRPAKTRRVSHPRNKSFGSDVSQDTLYDSPGAQLNEFGKSYISAKSDIDSYAPGHKHT